MSIRRNGTRRHVISFVECDRLGPIRRTVGPFGDSYLDRRVVEIMLRDNVMPDTVEVNDYVPSRHRPEAYAPA